MRRRLGRLRKEGQGLCPISAKIRKSKPEQQEVQGSTRKVKARALPWTRWGRRPQTPILFVPRSASAGSQLAMATVLLGQYRKLPPRSANDRAGTPSGAQRAEPPGRRSHQNSTRRFRSIAPILAPMGQSPLVG